ncbi:MAG: hypothetical protein RSE04_06115 [Hydrogenoanaerobacterium sp.]
MNSERMRITVSLPNKQGVYRPVVVPEYILDILENVSNQCLYTYKLFGVNPQRLNYGIRLDLEKLEAWAKRYGSNFEIKSIREETNNHYGIFKMTDPVASQLEKVGLIK